MGKKSKRSGATSNPPTSLQINNKAVGKVIEDLWTRTQVLENNTVPYLWSERDTIHVFTKVLLEKQGPSPSILPDRREALPTLEEWLAENGAKHDLVEIVELPKVGYAMRAKTDIKTEDKVIVVPRKLMMTSTTAQQGPLGKLIARDHMLQVMPNVTLAMHLLNERYNPHSFWRPYINSLPHTFTTPFYFSREDLEMLQSSPCIGKALMQIRNCAKLYSHLYRLIRATCDSSLHLYNVGFYFEDFLWAVSCVMSRQNEIPLRPDGKGAVLALIPLWDFCNHTNGHMTTFYNLDTQACDCYAQEDTPAGEEFRIFYGPRPNSDFLIHQGFVYTENRSDSLQFKLGLSSSDPDKALKKELLDRLEIPVTGYFSIHPLECPFSSQLIKFTRIFTANQVELKHMATYDKKDLTAFIVQTQWSGDEKVLDFIEKRCRLLLQTYKTSIDEDMTLLEQADTLSNCAVEAVKMRLCEKRMLLSACTFSQSARHELDIIRTFQERGVSYEEFRKEENSRAPGSLDLTVNREGVSGEDGGVGGGKTAGDENVNSPKQEVPSDKMGMVQDPSPSTANTVPITKQFETRSDSDTGADLNSLLNPSSTGAHYLEEPLSKSRESVPQQESTGNEVPEKKTCGQVGDSGLGIEDLALSDSVSSCDQ